MATAVAHGGTAGNEDAGGAMANADLHQSQLALAAALLDAAAQGAQVSWMQTIVTSFRDSVAHVHA